MYQRIKHFAIAGALAATVAAGATAKPAAADTLSDLITSAAPGALQLLTNVLHNGNATTNTVVGHTSNGGTVYGDGRIVMPNGQTYYASNNGQVPCSYIAANGACSYNARPYAVAQNAPRPYWDGSQRTWHRANRTTASNNGWHGEKPHSDNRNGNKHADRDDQGNQGNRGDHGDQGNHGDH